MANEWTNVTVTKGNFVIPIDVVRDEEILSKKNIALTHPTTNQNRPSGPKQTKIMDLLMVEERVNIDGYLSTNADDNSSTLKSNLKSAFKSGGVMTMTYEGTDITGNMDKLSIDKIDKDGGEPFEDQVGYKVKFTFLKGIDL